ncbi:DExH-box ATP-dependent RNA helicase DExH3 isoform X4 [Cynara cardunculus var. scolymus]|uniref:DExH-box ATP-dependent RNA helicase DExH3 isoform X4 n=1 Tax=Cynara cardunculus var. scolymus TaxID=59895 RepID=UPI000D628293|nr:DExH-box ATP-dependent RNA helicase DExH3 isoform X4 [Cynara cardunculus var. scolymus]
MHSRLGFLLACNSRRKPPLLATFFRIFTHNTLSNPSTSAVLSSSKINHGGPFFRFLSSIMHCGGRRYISGHAVDQFSDDEYECDYENHPASSSVANIDEWKWKLSMLLNSGTDQEIVTRDKRDKRDFEQISNLAKRMGLYCEMYGKVVVASKVPLPNYRPDLDDKRPQREVVIPLSLQRRVEGLLQEHLDRMQLYSGDVASSKSETSHQAELVNNGGHPDSLVDGSLMEKVLQRRSLQMRNMQRAWEESPEGKKMLLARMSLPAFREKERLLQAIAQNQVIIISGETGCGKTTQLPQYILESEIESGRGAFCNIICTQPRRISAMAVAERVSTERGEPLGESVGYKVRLEGMKGKNTHLLFCTSGILLRRLLSDHNLHGVTHVFVDEIHERGMNEDFLLIVLKDLLPRRRDLRLILMSATLNAELFSNYFEGAPMIHIPGFTHPVRAHFLEDIIEITGYKLTPFNQVDDYGQEKLWKTQRQLVPRKRKNQITVLVEDALSQSSLENYSSKARESLSCWTPDVIGFNLIEAVLCHICRKERPGAVLVFMTGWDDINCLKSQLRSHPLLGDPNRVHLLTCHGSMATSEQKASTAKSRFSAKDYSDHMALVRAYEGWKQAEREGSAYEYCWKNFLSAQTLQAIHSLRNQFNYILKDALLLEADAGVNNRLSHNQSLVRAIICSGLFPGIASVVHREASMSFKTMDDGQVWLYTNSVNKQYQTIPYPWLVFGEKVKVNNVFIRDSTGVSDSILILFGGGLVNGVLPGHLKMLGGYIDFFMDPTLAESYVSLKQELDQLLQKKLKDPNVDIHKEGKYLMLAIQELVSGDLCEGRFVFGRESKKPKESPENDSFTRDGANPKSLLQTLLMRAGHSPPKYKSKHLKTNEFRALVEFKGMQFVGKPKRNKQLAERDAAVEAMAWLTHTSGAKKDEGYPNSPPDLTDNMLKILSKPRKPNSRSGRT